MGWTSGELGVVVGGVGLAVAVYFGQREQKLRSEIEKGISVELGSVTWINEKTIQLKARFRTTRQTQSRVIGVRALRPGEARFRSAPETPAVVQIEPNWLVSPRRDDISHDLFVAVRPNERGLIRIQFSVETGSGRTLKICADGRIP